MAVYKNIGGLTGGTPLLELSGYARAKNLKAKIIAKLECFNPAGSVKDRVAVALIDQAEKSGKLKKDSVIIEPTSGNTGIALAAIAAAKGYKIILTMPETMSVERRKLLRFYGAEVILTDGKDGMSGAIAKAEELARVVPQSFIAGQFTDPANTETHRATTGPEIWNGTGGEVDCFVAGVGTGGTLTGAGEYLKCKNPRIKIIAVEPASSPVLSKGYGGAHGIQGIGAGFVPPLLNEDIIDEIIAAETDGAVSACRTVAKTDGIAVGISSGAALWAATEIAKREENAGKTIVVVFPDSGERYLSTDLYGK